MYKVVLLDVDGTLVDTVEAHAIAWHQAFADGGHDIQLQRIKRLIGMGGDKLVSNLIGVDEHSREVQKLSERHDELFRAALPRLHGIAGARAFVERLFAEGYQVAIATSSAAKDLEPLLALADLGELIPVRATADDADGSKPDPDIIEVALGKLHAEPASAVMIGDSPFDIAAAARARVDAIGVKTGGFPDEQLAGAIAVYKSVADLMERWDESALKRR